MKLTSFTDYSLRVLIYLGTQEGQRTTIAQIAAAFEISEHHLVKVVHFLGKRGWLTNVRGKGGGLQLARAPEQIVVGQLVRETEGEGELAECAGEGAHRCRIASCCQLRGVLGEAVAAFYRVLDRHTLADLMTNRAQLATVLFVDRGPARSGATA